MNNNKNTNKFLKSYSKVLSSEFKKELESKGKVASKGLVNSIEYKFSDAVSTIRIDFLYNSYGEWVQLGRKPGKFAPLKNIISWCKAKGINEKFAYAINYKIKEKGIKPFPFVENVVKSRSVEQEIEKKILDASGEDLQVEIEKIMIKK